MNNDNEKLDIGFKYAWDYFSYHASQRMQSFNFFLVSTAIILNGYLLCVEKKLYFPAIIIGILGFCFSICFLIIDNRNSQLVKNGEKALKHYESLFWTDEQVQIITRDDERIQNTPRWKRVGPSFRVMITVSAIVFFLGIIFSGYMSKYNKSSSVADSVYNQTNGAIQK